MNIPAEQMLQALRTRFACKKFDPNRRIAEDDFQAILEAGRLSPSSFGFEPWQFTVVQNAGLREKIRDASWGIQQQMPGLSHLIVIYARQPGAMRPDGAYLTGTIMKNTQNMPPELLTARVDKIRNFFSNDFALSGNDRAIFEWACRQCYLALENMLLMATMLGLDACPVEGFDKEKLESLLEKEGVLDRNEFGVACMAAFGYCQTPPHRAKSRRPMTEVVRWVE